MTPTSIQQPVEHNTHVVAMLLTYIGLRINNDVNRKLPLDLPLDFSGYAPPLGDTHLPNHSNTPTTQKSHPRSWYNCTLNDSSCPYIKTTTHTLVYKDRPMIIPRQQSQFIATTQMIFGGYPWLHMLQVVYRNKKLPNGTRSWKENP